MNMSLVINRQRLILIALVALVAVVAAVWATEKPDTASATTQLTVGLDMKTTQGAAGTYGTLPTFEQCVDVSTSVNNGIFYIDVFVLDVTNLFAFNADISFSPLGKMQIIGTDVEQFLGSVAVSNYSDSTVPPVNDGSFTAAAVFQVGGGEEPLVSGSGVMARIEAQGLFAAGGSVVNFQIATGQYQGVTLTTDPGAQHPGDTTGDGIFDGPFVNAVGTIAIDRPDTGDGDGVSNDCDNCPNTPNADQADNEGDGVGDVCDTDDDNDGVSDVSDNCPWVYNPTQDPLACGHSDSDGIPDGLDNCPTVDNAGQENNDGDAEGDVCDTDDDNDGVLDVSDNCQFAANAGQENWNGGALGDACEDSDSDGWLDAADNCKGTSNVTQSNVDGDDPGDACDNCPNTPNNDQADNDFDGLGDVCDDSDGDGFLDAMELFTGTNTNQACAVDGTRENEHPDATPFDNNDDQMITTADVGKYVTVLNHIAGDGVYLVRYDVSMDDIITTADVGFFVTVLNYICTP